MEARSGPGGGTAKDRKPSPEGERKRGGPSTARARFNTIYTELRDRICTLVYLPGAALSEAALAAEFKVSRTPIRRVLNRLEFDGLVEIRHGAGTFVTSAGEDDLADIYGFRMRLVELMGDLHPRPVAPEGLQRIRDILARARAHGPAMTPVEYWRLNTQFQSEVNACIGNRFFKEINERLYYFTNRHWLEHYALMDWETEVTSFVREIEDTIGCFELNDLRGVGLVRRNAISGMFRRLTACLNAADAARRSR